MRWRPLSIGLLFLAGYVLPLYAPPSSTATDVAGGWLMERLFPGVPVWWVVARLLSLLTATVLIGFACPLPATLAARPRLRPGRFTAPRAPLALALAVALALAALAAATFERWQQVAFVMALWLPVLVLLRPPEYATWRPPGSSALLTLGVVAGWATWRLACAVHSPRSADPIDTLMSLNEMKLAADPSINLLVEGAHVGVSSLHLFVHGIAFFEWFPQALSLQALQFTNVLWFSVAALLLAGIVGAAGRAALAPVAAATLLFSPFALLGPLVAAPLYLGSLLTAALLALLWRLVERRSSASLVAFAVIAGMGVSHPATALPALALLAVSAYPMWQLGVPRAVAGAAALCFFAAAFPGLPDLQTLGEMSQSFATGKVAWLPLEQMLLGQRSPVGVEEVLQAGRPGVFDAVWGSLLSPFAIPRTSLRLWGDALYEPWTAAFAACGVVLCLRQRAGTALIVLGLLAVTLASGFVSSYDRPSLTRTMAAPVPIALLAVIGLDGLLSMLSGPVRSMVTTAVVGICVLSGSVLFDAVNPSILARSSTGIAIEALAASATTERVRVLMPGGASPYEWLRIDLTSAEVPVQPLRNFKIRSRGSVEHLLARSVDVVTWSPALEADFEVRREICALRPAAVTYVMNDPAGLSRSFAADVASVGWEPDLPRSRWSKSRCHAAMRGTDR